jgi:hypothetical protein
VGVVGVVGGVTGVAGVGSVRRHVDCICYVMGLYECRCLLRYQLMVLS